MAASENQSPLAGFNEAAYLAANPDVAQAIQAGTYGGTAAQHYADWGINEGRATDTSGGHFGSAFDTNAYLAANPDVANAISSGSYTDSALQHYLDWGLGEGRSLGLPASGLSTLGAGADVSGGLTQGYQPDIEGYYAGSVDSSTPETTATYSGPKPMDYGYVPKLPENSAGVNDPFVVSADTTAKTVPLVYDIPKFGGFSEFDYLSANPDLLAAINSGAYTGTPLEHYLKYGYTEGRALNPTGYELSPGFNENAYYSANPDVLKAIAAGTYGGNALEHYLKYGAGEGRALDAAKFDPEAYLTANTDLKTAIDSGAYTGTALDHYLKYGYGEGRKIDSSGYVLPAGFSEQAYLAANPDVKAAIQNGTYTGSAFEHYLKYGAEENRDIGDTRDVVNSFYQSAVGHDADPKQTAYWASKLEKNEIPWEDFQKAVLATPEAQKHAYDAALANPVSYWGNIYAKDDQGNFITETDRARDEWGNINYQDDRPGATNYVKSGYGFDTGMRPDENWDQYNARVNSYYTNAVGSMYENMLGRPASADEINNWAKAYSYNGDPRQMNLEDIQRNIAASPEFQKNLADSGKGTWLTLNGYETVQKQSQWGSYESTEPVTKGVYIPPAVAAVPGAVSLIAGVNSGHNELVSGGYGQANTNEWLKSAYPQAFTTDLNGNQVLNSMALAKAIEADPKKFAEDQLHLLAYDLKAAELVANAGFRNSGVTSESVQPVADRLNKTAEWLVNSGVSADQVKQIFNEGQASADKHVSQSIRDQKDTGSGWIDEIGDFLEKYQVPIMTAILGGAVLAPAAIGAAGLTAGSAGAAAMTGGVTGLTSAAGALANGADWKNALLTGGLTGLTAGTLHGLGGLGGGAGAIDSGVAGSTVDQASVDAFLSGASGKLTPAELVDYASFFADQGYNVGNLDMVSSWSPFAQETFQRAVDMGIDPSFAATKIQEGLLDTGVPGSVLDQSSVNAMLQENPEYAQFFKGQGYNVDAAKGLTSVDSIHNQLVSAFDDAYKTNIADLMKVYEPTAQTNVTIYGYADVGNEGNVLVPKTDVGASGGASQNAATVAEVGGKIDDAAKIVSDAATKTPETTVKELYKTLLDRAPETAALEYWSDLIASGASTAGGVAGAIIGSTEFGGKIGAGAGGAGSGTGRGPGTGSGSGPGGSGPGTGPGGSGPGGDVEGPVTEGEPVTEGGIGGGTTVVPPVVPPVVVPPTTTPLPETPTTETPTTETPTTETPTTPKTPSIPKVPSTPSIPTIPTLPKTVGTGSGTGGVLQHNLVNLTGDVVGGSGDFSIYDPTSSPMVFSLPTFTNMFGGKGYADGGLVATEHVPEFYSEGGLNNRYVTGNGDGTSDDVPAMLANGEFVIPADVVSSLGNGSNDSGAAVLDEFLQTIRAHKQKHDPKKLPPDSLGPLAYLNKATKKAGK